jgi:uncharacterized circularly permuted ATP-grasp superfamily protein
VLKSRKQEKQGRFAIIIAKRLFVFQTIFISSGYLAQCEGTTPPKEIYSHISGIDLVKGKDEEWHILEDNLRVPSGASYPMIARELCRRCSPETFKNTKMEEQFTNC